MSTPRKLAAGNWKMNGTAAELSEVKTLLAEQAAPGCDVLLCPPATLIHRMAQAAEGSILKVGGQDCHARQSGAHTGDISAAMLKDAGASHVILGHSERRADHGESDEDVRAKAEAALAAGLVAVICVGETLEQRESGATLDIVAAQLGGSIPDDVSAGTLVVAYEPVWAIGTGKVPETAQIAEVHDFIRARLSSRFGEAGQGVALLYGGSVKPSNAAEIFAVENVNGALVGGASLKAADFGAIVAALSDA
ncbi:triose-phosphate isomerase [Oceaniglobus roseus]|uniref:triose-phosphate isomerase n=1 Tax=Oceaniglobus roseus TaxID=1737570 RepID=UPI000C7EF36D|nr:triose-phosphate isomerase [Kandeliimicrobium roseum]